MDRREMLGVVGVGAAGLLATGSSASAQDVKRFSYRSQLDRTHVECLDACTACASVCNEASEHCLKQIEKGSTDKDHHIRSHHLTMDCAAMCSTGAALVARQSTLMDAQCTACADACRRCAEECERGRDDAEIMKECVRLCRECEKSCRQMVKAMGSQAGGNR
jgi:hypothetical protein